MCPPSEHPVVRVVEEIDPAATMSSFLRRMLMFKRAGIREYWAVDPSERQVRVFSLRCDGLSGSEKLPADWERMEAAFFAAADGALS